MQVEKVGRVGKLQIGLEKCPNEQILTWNERTKLYHQNLTKFQ